MGGVISCAAGKPAEDDTIYRVCLKYFDKIQSFTSKQRERFTQIYVCV